METKNELNAAVVRGSESYLIQSGDGVFVMKDMTTHEDILIIKKDELGFQRIWNSKTGEPISCVK